jgi:hypothetical protein
VQSGCLDIPLAVTKHRPAASFFRPSITASQNRASLPLIILENTYVSKCVITPATESFLSVYKLYTGEVKGDQGRRPSRWFRCRLACRVGDTIRMHSEELDDGKRRLSACSISPVPATMERAENEFEAREKERKENERKLQEERKGNQQRTNELQKQVANL